MFKKVLIANRAVIGCRILKTLKEHKIHSVSVYTPGDENSLHVKDSEQNICIRAYNEIPEIISVAESFKVEAVHPGVGFLSENIDFAKVAGHYTVFIGPSTSHLSRMGNKVMARLIAQEAGLPITPGSKEAIKTEREAIQIGNAIGYPLIVKAADGGGGMGLERVMREEDLTPVFFRVREQAKTLFKSEAVFIEKLISPNRHIEVQILGDSYGNVVHLGERDCSIQRSHQKLIEYSPAQISNDLRTAITDSAVKIAKAVGYRNAGTVEFLVDDKENFYFMEMNTRIQVEHRVTEMVYGKDLIYEQIRIAAGERLGYAQNNLASRGFALECRVNAEDPEKNFEASPGAITRFVPPEGDNIIVDTFIPLLDKNGTFQISTAYDSLLANVITWGEDKREAVALMEKSLKAFAIEGKGVKTTIPFHLWKIREL